MASFRQRMYQLTFCKRVRQTSVCWCSAFSSARHNTSPPHRNDPLKSPAHAAHSSYFPYPATYNWQKAIGGHIIWLSAEVTVQQSGIAASRVTIFSVQLIFHAEDRYNFRPGQADIATGTPDSENGRLSRARLGHQYMHYLKLVRLVGWTGIEPGVDSSKRENTDQAHQPRNNRGPTSRI